MSFATADPIVKIAPPSMPIVSGHRRPMSSEDGAQITGPKAKPSTKKVVPRVPTSVLTLNCFLAAFVPGAKTALVNDAVRVPGQDIEEM